jgi:hypothetical protein
VWGDVGAESATRQAAQVLHPLMTAAATEALRAVGRLTAPMYKPPADPRLEPVPVVDWIDEMVNEQLSRGDNR